MDTDVTDLKERVDLAALVEADLGPAYKHHGRWWLWRCPFHADRKPSLAVTPDTGTWHCFGCGESGDHITWLQKREGLGFREALERLASLAGAPMERSGPLARPASDDGPPPSSWQERAQAVVAECEQKLWENQGTKARAWLNQRGLTDESLRLWRLGYNPADQRIQELWVPRGIVIPCFSEGKLHYLKIRRPVPPLNGPKYQHVKNGKPALFGLDFLEGKRVVVICEGELDAILLQQKSGDLVDVVAVGSATSRPPQHFLLHLARSARWLVALDHDGAGEKGADWWGDFSSRVRRVRPLQGNDLTEFHQAGGDLRAWVTFHLKRLETEDRSQHRTYVTLPTRSEPAVSREDLETEAQTLLDQMDRDPGVVKRYAEIAQALGWPCFGITWAQWAAAVTGLYPLTLRFPADTRAATIEGKWQRLPNGTIEATYNAQDELAWSLTAVGVDSPEIQRALG